MMERAGDSQSCVAAMSEWCESLLGPRGSQFLVTPHHSSLGPTIQHMVSDGNLGWAQLAEGMSDHGVDLLTFGSETVRANMLKTSPGSMSVTALDLRTLAHGDGREVEGDLVASLLDWVCVVVRNGADDEFDPSSGHRIDLSWVDWLFVPWLVDSADAHTPIDSLLLMTTPAPSLLSQRTLACVRCGVSVLDYIMDRAGHALALLGGQDLTRLLVSILTGLMSGERSDSSRASVRLSLNSSCVTWPSVFASLCSTVSRCASRLCALHSLPPLTPDHTQTTDSLAHCSTLTLVLSFRSHRQQLPSAAERSDESSVDWWRRESSVRFREAIMAGLVKRMDTQVWETQRPSSLTHEGMSGESISVEDEESFWCLLASLMVAPLTDDCSALSSALSKTPVASECDIVRLSRLLTSQYSILSYVFSRVHWRGHDQLAAGVLSELSGVISSPSAFKPGLTLILYGIHRFTEEVEHTSSDLSSLSSVDDGGLGVKLLRAEVSGDASGGTSDGDRTPFEECHILEGLWASLRSQLSDLRDTTHSAVLLECLSAITLNLRKSSLTSTLIWRTLHMLHPIRCAHSRAAHLTPATPSGWYPPSNSPTPHSQAPTSTKAPSYLRSPTPMGDSAWLDSHPVSNNELMRGASAA